jgi:hypothetical protein
MAARPARQSEGAGVDEVDTPPSQGAAACQDPQMPGQRAKAGRIGHGRRVRAEGQRSRGDGLWRGHR